MGDATTLLFDLPGFRVASVELTPLNLRRVIVMQVADEHGCPRCGVLVGGKPYDVREMRVKDLPVGHRPLLVVWRKRRYRCLHRLARFHEVALTSDMPETTRLAETISTWWPEIEAFLRLRVTNARTEGGNRVIKQLKRVGCGYRNQGNYEHRILLHIAATNAA